MRFSVLPQSAELDISQLTDQQVRDIDAALLGAGIDLTQDMLLIEGMRETVRRQIALMTEYQYRVINLMQIMQRLHDRILTLRESVDKTEVYAASDGKKITGVS